MKINNIVVEKLFGVFHHTIPINNETGITIIIGENGLGKTVVLEMIEAFFKGNFLYFSNVEFEKMIFEFDDKESWILSKNVESNNEEGLFLIRVSKTGRKSKSINLFEFDEEHIQMMTHRIRRNYPHLRRVDKTFWEDRRTGELLHRSEVLHIYDKRFQYELEFKDEKKPSWFTKRMDLINVSLIETQRLISLKTKEENLKEKTVEKYALELSRTIRQYLTQSTELSSKLDRTYPNRLIERLKHSKNTSKEFLYSELKRLEDKREMLDEVGLIEIEKDSNLLSIESADSEIIDVLMLYVEDSFEKVKIFDTISRKIELFIGIINKRFKHKKLIIDKEYGFRFDSTIIKDNKGNWQNIPVTKLSSGEQNELVLFYLLLFKTDSNSLILVDEPEVSLHISWQNSFIKDLKEITKLNNLDVVIATHSPDIIADNWDLRVELKGVE
jgi:predicted ATP-binding protein involved in virulence